MPKLLLTRRAPWWCLAALLTACPGPPPVTEDAGVTADVTAPRVVRTEPSHQLTGVPTRPAFLVQFSEPMKTGQVSVLLNPGVSLGVGSWNTRGDTVSFPDADPLQFSTVYTLEVSGRDLADNELVFAGATFITEAMPIADAGVPDAGTPDGGGSSDWDLFDWEVGTWR